MAVAGDRVQFTHKRERPSGKFLERTLRGVIVDVVEDRATVSTGGEIFDVLVKDLTAYVREKPKGDPSIAALLFAPSPPSESMKAITDEVKVKAAKARAGAEKAK